LDNGLSQKEFDVIVVGSGPGGSTIARELSKRKKKVLILERGASSRIKEGGLPSRSMLNSVSLGEHLTTATAFTTGGTTVIYFAVSGHPPLDAFRSLGIDLSQELEDAKRELPLSVLPDELLGAQARKVRASALELGYPWQGNPMLIDQSKCGSSYSSAAKWNAQSYLQQAVDYGATLLTNARVHKALIEQGRAIGVEYALHEGKRNSEVRQAFAPRTILAAGVLASPIILRNSGIKSVVNSGFFCYPTFALFGLAADLKAGDNFIGSTGAELGDGIALSDANAARTLYQMFMLANRRFSRIFLHSKSVAVAVKVREGLSGPGLQANGRYHKTLKKEDYQKLAKGEEAARRIIQNAGGKHIFKSRLSAAQTGGTIRINEHLDQDLQTEYRNLHVCDGSVLPESLKVPPTLPLICLGKYLANRLSPLL
jgi:GMC oxidoreductase/NAD(P)-binding Rossmann-like domain